MTNNYSELANNSTSGWNATNANTVLIGYPNLSIIGTVWVILVPEIPYLLLNTGYSVYSITNIINNPPALVRNYNTSVYPGNSTSGGLPVTAQYYIIGITGGNSDSYNTIAIDSGTGIVSTTLSTIPAVYTVYIFNFNNYYGSFDISTITLTVINNVPLPPRSPSFKRLHAPCYRCNYCKCSFNVVGYYLSSMYENDY